MADFVQTMKDWKRMCISCQPNCEKCGLFEMGCDTSNMMNEPERAEKIIAKWAAEHPEPVYPTFAEWLHNIGVTISDRPFPAPNIPVYVFQVGAKMFEPIPADMAEKLDVKPKQ